MPLVPSRPTFFRYSIGTAASSPTPAAGARGIAAAGGPAIRWARMERLSEIYWELQTDAEPIGLEEFVQRAVAGQYGPVNRDELCAFLRAVEERLVHGIEAGETAHDGAARDDLVEETHGWIDDLIAKFCET